MTEDFRICLPAAVQLFYSSNHLNKKHTFNQRSDTPTFGEKQWRNINTLNCENINTIEQLDKKKQVKILHFQKRRSVQNQEPPRMPQKFQSKRTTDISRGQNPLCNISIGNKMKLNKRYESPVNDSPQSEMLAPDCTQLERKNINVTPKANTEGVPKRNVTLPKNKMRMQSNNSLMETLRENIRSSKMKVREEQLNSRDSFSFSFVNIKDCSKVQTPQLQQSSNTDSFISSSEPCSKTRTDGDIPQYNNQITTTKFESTTLPLNSHTNISNNNHHHHHGSGQQYKFSLDLALPSSSNQQQHPKISKKSPLFKMFGSSVERASFDISKNENVSRNLRAMSSLPTAPSLNQQMDEEIASYLPVYPCWISEKKRESSQYKSEKCSLNSFHIQIDSGTNFQPDSTSDHLSSLQTILFPSVPFENKTNNIQYVNSAPLSPIGSSRVLSYKNYPPLFPSVKVSSPIKKNRYDIFDGEHKSINQSPNFSSSKVSSFEIEPQILSLQKKRSKMSPLSSREQSLNNSIEKYPPKFINNCTLDVNPVKRADKQHFRQSFSFQRANNTNTNQSIKFQSPSSLHQTPREKKIQENIENLYDPQRLPELGSVSVTNKLFEKSIKNQNQKRTFFPKSVQKDNLIHNLVDVLNLKSSFSINQKFKMTFSPSPSSNAQMNSHAQATNNSTYGVNKQLF